jgi:tRNA-specific 2-thiouridylase
MENNVNSIKGNNPIVVAMSGGVDSSVAAALMNKDYDDVIGVTLRLYDEKKVANSKTCCSGADIMDAKKIANTITIPHYVFDYEEIFKKNVIEPFINEYKLGRTPIPCINCNEKVKFLDLLSFAREINAKSLVTGHYIKKVKINNEWRLYIPHDEERDQTYFLFTMKKDDLDIIEFPLGDYKKEEIRNLALKLKLHVFDKIDSQDICFIPDGDYKKFVNKNIDSKEGEVVDEDGNVLNRHDGIQNFTIGQRRGLGVSQDKPLYVKKIDKNKNRVIVASKDNISSSTINVKNVNLITDNFPNELYVRVRSTGKLLSAKIKINKEGGATISLAAPEIAVSPGQACVFYCKDEIGSRLLGGGWIHSTNE